MIENDNRPIGVFDSGIGGVTVLRELIRRFPQENFLYLGDTARLPYGSKSAETVRKYSLQNMKYLISRQVKAIVIACNTASTQVSEKDYDGIPVYNVIDPGAQLACRETRNGKIAVLATRATVKANTYTKKIHEIKPDVQVYSQACPLFVPLAEEGWHDDPITNLIAYRYLQGVKEKQIDTVVLGCTHYPLLKKAIGKVFGNDVQLIDSGEAVAEEMEKDFRAEKIKKSSTAHGQITIALTDAGAQFENLSRELISEVNSDPIHFETVSVI